MKHNYSYSRGIFGLVALTFLMGIAVAASHEPGVCTIDAPCAKSQPQVQTTREDFCRNMQTNLDQISSQIETLKTRAQNANSSLQGKLKHRIARLEKRRHLLQKQLNQVGKASGKAWEKLRGGVESAWLELKKGVEKVQSETN